MLMSRALRATRKARTIKNNKYFLCIISDFVEYVNGKKYVLIHKNKTNYSGISLFKKTYVSCIYNNFE